MASKTPALGLNAALPEPMLAAEMIRDYAQPLLFADPAGPADMETMRTAVMLAVMCWNLPVYEATGNQLYLKGKRALKTICESVPTPVAATVRQLLEDRKRTYAEAPFIMLVEVTGTTPQNATIVAEARRPSLAPPK